MISQAITQRGAVAASGTAVKCSVSFGYVCGSPSPAPRGYKPLLTCASHPAPAGSTMRTVGILLVGVLALCAQLQLATTAPSAKGECSGDVGRPHPAGSQGAVGLAPAGGPVWGKWVRPVTPARSQDLPWCWGTPGHHQQAVGLRSALRRGAAKVRAVRAARGARQQEPSCPPSAASRDTAGPRRGQIIPRVSQRRNPELLAARAPRLPLDRCPPPSLLHAGSRRPGSCPGHLAWPSNALLLIIDHAPSAGGRDSGAFPAAMKDPRSPRGHGHRQRDQAGWRRRAPPPRDASGKNLWSRARDC